MSHVRALPSFNLALHPSPDHSKGALLNIPHPSRPSIPSAGSSAPLVFSRTTRPEIAVASPNIQVPAPNTWFDTCSVPDAFYGVGMLIWHNLSMIIQKLKLVKQKLFGF